VQRFEEQGEVAVAELTGPLLVGGAHGGELFEHEGEVVDCEVGSDGAGLLGTFEQLHVELLGPFCSAVQLLGGFEGPGQAKRQRVCVRVHDAPHELGEDAPGVAMIGKGGLGGGDVALYGVTVFAEDISIRRYAEQSNNIVHWSEFDRGGHFAALEAPDLLIADVREFFHPLR
jgi:hypothetical protein